MVRSDFAPKLAATRCMALSSSFLTALCKAIRASMVGRSLGMTPADTLTGSDRTAIAIKAATKNAL